MISTNRLTKRYGSLTALDDLTLEIAPGEVFGLIGPNGAGKTTTLRILATLLRPTSGTVRVAGHELAEDAAGIRRAIGYMPDFAGAYEDMRVDEYLYFFAAAARITGTQADGVIRDVLELTDLSGRREALVEALSRGMRQRLGIARVLLHDPKVLLLDEPASGLDPRARVEMRMLLKELRGMGKTVVISSHILSELAELCTTVGILEQGRLVFTGTVEDLLRRVRSDRTVLVRVGGEETPRAQDLLRADPRIEDAAVADGVIQVRLAPTETDASFLPALLVGAGFALHHFSEEALTLEDAFMRLTRGLVR